MDDFLAPNAAAGKLVVPDPYVKIRFDIRPPSKDNGDVRTASFFISSFDGAHQDHFEISRDVASNAIQLVQEVIESFPADWKYPTTAVTGLDALSAYKPGVVNLNEQGDPKGMLVIDPHAKLDVHYSLFVVRFITQIFQMLQVDEESAAWALLPKADPGPLFPGQ